MSPEPHDMTIAEFVRLWVDRGYKYVVFCMEPPVCIVRVAENSDTLSSRDVEDTLNDFDGEGATIGDAVKELEESYKLYEDA